MAVKDNDFFEKKRIMIINHKKMVLFSIFPKVVQKKLMIVPLKKHHEYNKMVGIWIIKQHIKTSLQVI